MGNKLKSKLIYAKTRDAFKREYEAGNMIPNLNPLVFIEESKEFWIMGNYYSIESPTVTVTEKESIVSVNVGDSSFRMTAGGNITVRKGIGDENTIVFSSTALSSITTEYPLYWDYKTSRLLHEKSGIEESIYGPSSDLENASYITIPWFSVNEYGHLVDATERSIKIRDYVVQTPTVNDRGNFNILLGSAPNEEGDEGITRKALGLSYEPQTKRLFIEGGFDAGASTIDGGLVVTGGMIEGTIKGDITGTATPKIHTSKEPEFGGASTELYGHVRLEDDLGTQAPAPSSREDDDTSAMIERGVAASPYMVWNVRKEVKDKIEGLPIIEEIGIGAEGAEKQTIRVSETDGVLGIQIQGGLQGGVNPETNELYLKSVAITGYNKTHEKIYINNKLEFTSDFEVENDKLSIRWTELKQ